MSPQGLFLGAVARWPLSCPKSLLSPPASPSRAPVAQSCRLGSAQPELAGPGRAGRPADPPPLLSQAQHPAGRGRLGARARCAPRAGRRARRGLTLRSPGQLQSNYGAPQVTCAGGAAGARIRERAAGTAAGEGRRSPGICLVITWHKASGVSASSVPRPSRREGGWGGRTAGPWSAARCTPAATWNGTASLPLKSPA